MFSRRIASAALLILVALGLLVVPASAASDLTCNGGYTSSGPMGGFTYKFSRDVRIFTGSNYEHDFKVVLTYKGVDGFSIQREHDAVNGFLKFTDIEKAPGFVQGVDITDETFIDGQPKGAFYNHPSCKTYAQAPAPTPDETEPSGSAPGTLSSSQAPGTPSSSQAPSTPAGAKSTPESKKQSDGSGQDAAQAGTEDTTPTSAEQYDDKKGWLTVAAIVAVPLLGWSLQRLRRRLTTAARARARRDHSG